ncbi:MAG TPA: hypothetical protein DDW49_04085 [Deltaproteobacteria bacterium]|nr:MAG: hypothetical protein A2048_04000 [Deltaproteobacteria bacterium GWA2_45_12]HBF12559.1 hypothetical protein [Deltaproteobacteria bacterium]
MVKGDLMKTFKIFSIAVLIAFMGSVCYAQELTKDEEVIQKKLIVKRHQEITAENMATLQTLITAQTIMPEAMTGMANLLKTYCDRSKNMMIAYEGLSQYKTLQDELVTLQKVELDIQQNLEKCTQNAPQLIQAVISSLQKIAAAQNITAEEMSKKG